MAEIHKKQVTELVPYSGADAPLDLGSQNITTTGTITAATFVGAGSGGGSWGTITGTLSAQTDLQSALDLKAAITDIAELSQDAVGTILTDSATIDFTYTDATPAITASIITGSVTNAMLAGSITVAKGGTGATTFTTNALLRGNGTSAVSALALGTANQMLGMNSGATANEYKTLSVGTTGTDFAIAHSAGGIAFNLPDASASNRGAITTGAQTIAGAKTFSSIPLGPASDPTTANQLTRKSYVDAIALTVDKSLLKSAARTIAITNGTLATAYENGDTVNGVIIATNDRIVLNGQTDSAENGIYSVNASGAPTRANDYDVAGEVVQGSQVYVTSGNSPGLYVMISPDVTTLGTDPITFTQIAGLSDNTFAVGTSGSDFNVSVIGTDVTYNLPTASATVRGALSTTDWSTFNSKVSGSGTVTQGNLPVWGDTTGQLLDQAFGVFWSDDYGGFGRYLVLGEGNDSMNVLLRSDVTLRMGLGASNTFRADSDGTFGLGVGALIMQNVDYPFGIAGEDFLALSLSGDVLLVGNPGVGYSLPLTAGTSGQALLAGGSGSPLTWGTVPQATDIQIFTSSGTWTKPSGSPKSTQIIAIGGGGGGGSGRKGAAGTVRGGGGGGQGGAWSTRTLLTSTLGSTETITVGTGGSGGASRTTSDTNGAIGSFGGKTTFGGWLGAAGIAGAAAGGNSTSGGFPSVTLQTSGGTGGSASGSGASGGAAGLSYMTGGGGGAGGGITTGNVASSGSAGGSVGSTSVNIGGYATVISGGTAGATSTAGGVGNDSPTNSGIGGSGGGGGGSSTSTNAGAGANGGLYGGGGGGGGGATNSVGNSGAGGTGGNGILIAITHY